MRMVVVAVVAAAVDCGGSGGGNGRVEFDRLKIRKGGKKIRKRAKA